MRPRVARRPRKPPRALGNRSIIGDARSPTMQSAMNLKIKFRESFRPFAPSVLRERVAEWFDLYADSPYMLLVGEVAASRRVPVGRNVDQRWGIDWLNVPKSIIPAVTHVDYSARFTPPAVSKRAYRGGSHDDRYRRRCHQSSATQAYVHGVTSRRLSGRAIVVRHDECIRGVHPHTIG